MTLKEQNTSHNISSLLDVLQRLWHQHNIVYNPKLSIHCASKWHVTWIQAVMKSTTRSILWRHRIDVLNNVRQRTLKRITGRSMPTTHIHYISRKIMEAIYCSPRASTKTCPSLFKICHVFICNAWKLQTFLFIMCWSPLGKHTKLWRVHVFAESHTLYWWHHLRPTRKLNLDAKTFDLTFRCRGKLFDLPYKEDYSFSPG